MIFLDLPNQSTFPTSQSGWFSAGSSATISTCSGVTSASTQTSGSSCSLSGILAISANWIKCYSTTEQERRWMSITEHHLQMYRLHRIMWLTKDFQSGFCPFQPVVARRQLLYTMIHTDRAVYINVTLSIINFQGESIVVHDDTCRYFESL